MRGLGRFFVLLMIVGLVCGCAKKQVTPIGGEVVPPSPPLSAPQPGGEIVPQPLEMPTVAPGAMGVVPPGLEDEVKAFESSDIYFDFDQYTITPEGRKICAQKASFLKAHPQLKLRIEGHCDERGTTEYNLALGERRAQEVRKYLGNLGVEALRIATISYGEERPAVAGHNEESWAKNRRAHCAIEGN